MEPGDKSIEIRRAKEMRKTYKNLLNLNTQSMIDTT